MYRWLVPLALWSCAPDHAKIVRTLGYGLAIEGGAVFCASYAAQRPGDSVGQAAAIASPLVVAGVIAIVAGRPWPGQAPPR